MLHPKNNRIDYGEQLIPPEGYELTSAIGTTYSLDLETLMVLPVALFYSQLLDESTDNLRFDMLESITRASEKITVYYQSGQLKVPNKYHHLMAYWEQGIVPVTMPNHVSSFHPKIWIVRYDKKGDPTIYRMLVTSRNLVNNRDWDIAFASDGVVQEKEDKRNDPLVHLLEYLNATDRRISSSFISDLRKAKFEIPHPFTKLKFHPVGVSNVLMNQRYKNPLTESNTSWKEMLIVSPFVDDVTLKKLQNSVERTPVLLSRKSELDCVGEEVLRGFSNWQFSRYIEEGERHTELEEGVESMDQNLHAKLFVTDKGVSQSWYLGSANCTDPAQGRNVEFMIELITNKSAAGPKQVLKQLTSEKDGDACLFTPYSFLDRHPALLQKQIELEVRKIKYDLSCQEFRGDATRIIDGTAFDLTIEVDLTSFKLPEAYEILIRPLPEKHRSAQKIYPGNHNRIKEFKGYTETMLSPFIEVQIWRDGLLCGAFLLTMDIILPESRLNKIFTSIIDSSEKFLKYLTFLLTGEDAELINSAVGAVDRLGIGLKSNSLDSIPVFENMMIAASRSPDKLNAINTLIDRIKKEAIGNDEQIISEEFEEFWGVFRKYLGEQNSK